MGLIATRANAVYDDFVTTGLPASGKKKPVKADIRALFGDVDNEIARLDADFTGLQDDLGDIRDCIVFSFTGASSPSSGADLTALWDQKVAVADITGRTFVVRGEGALDRRWFKLQPGRRFPQRAATVIMGPCGVRGTTSLGILFAQTGSVHIRAEGGGLLVDGGNTSETVAAGYVSGHIGMQIRHPVYGTTITDVVIEGLKFQNFGEYGLETYFLDYARLNNVSGKRIGVAADIHWSPLQIRITGGVSENIFPGLPAGDWQRNCYGSSISQFTGDRQGSGIYEFRIVIDVPTWCGLDTHSSSGVRFINCIVSGCSQGIAFENHIAGVVMSEAVVQGCQVTGFSGGTTVKDGLTCYSVLGIGLNSSGAPAAAVITVIGNKATSCGEARPGVTGAGAIMVRHARAVTIKGNILRVSRQNGIVLIGTTPSTDEILLADVEGNTIDGVSAHNGVQLGVAVYSHVLGRAMNNIVNNLGSAAASYARLGTAVYAFNFGSVGGLSTTSPVPTNFWN